MNLKSDTVKKIAFRVIELVVETILDIICPKRCIVCNRMVNTGRKVSVCTGCRNEITAKRKITGDSDTIYEEAVSALVYDGYVRDAMMRYKFNGKRYLHSTFSWIIWQNIKNRNYIGEIDMICPVPIHPLRKREYNQSSLIAGDLAEMSGLKVADDILIKICNVKPLSKMGFRERRTFIRDSVAFNPAHNIKGKNILLVDDTLTTGSTVCECTRILKMYGAKKVYVASACYADQDDNKPDNKIEIENENENEGGMSDAYANLFAD